jgi:hypothetical protein
MQLASIYRALGDGTPWPQIDESAALRLRSESADLLVAGTLDALGVDRWPAADREPLNRRRQQVAAHELVEAKLLAGTLSRLSHRGEPCLILKGAAIARTHYAVSWWRLRGDIDLLVRAGSLPPVDAALRDVGWRAAVEPAQPIVSGQRHYTHEAPAAPPLDLHLRLLAPVLEHSPAFDDLWPARRIVAGLENAWTLSDADALWYGCVHLALHHGGETRPLWLFDLDRLARGLGGAAWRAFVERAERSQTRAVCAAMLEAAADLFGTSVPPEVRAWQTVTGEHSVRILHAPSELRLQLLNVGALKGWRGRAGWVRAHLFPDGEYMRQRYGARGHVGLAMAYARRVVSGALRWVQDTAAGKR